MRPALLLLALLLLTVVGGCERPFVEEAPPTVTILAPDLAEVVTDDPTVEVVLRVTSALRAIDTVRVNGAPAAFAEVDSTFRTTVTLARGVNELRVEAVDAAGNRSQASRFGVYLPARFGLDPSVRLPEGRGGHAAARLADGRVLLTGGATSAGGPATDDAFLFDPATNVFTRLPATLRTPRVGHTATPLPDGRVLIAGGARTAQPTSLDVLAPDAEVFDPQIQAFETLPLDVGNPPLARTDHAAHAITLDGRTFLYLLGGRGRISFSGTTLGTRSDFRILELLGGPERLRSPIFDGPSLSGARQAVAAFAFAPVAAPDPQGFGDFVLAGTYVQPISGQVVVDSVALAVSFTEAEAYEERALPPMRTARVGHAGARIDDGLALLAGGQVLGSGAPVETAEVYARAARRFFAFPLANGTPRLAIPRYGHTATKLADGRILLTGGFDAAGRGLTSVEFFAITVAP